MNIEMQIIHEVKNQTESFYDDAIQLGNHAAYALKKDHRSQLTGLENITNSALTVTDILDYIKRQTARFPYWREVFPAPENPSKDPFGKRLLDYIEQDLATKRDRICGKNKLNIGKETDEERQLRRRVYLLLIRQFLRNMIVQYEYDINFNSRGNGA